MKGEPKKSWASGHLTEETFQETTTFEQWTCDSSLLCSQSGEHLSTEIKLGCCWFVCVFVCLCVCACFVVSFCSCLFLFLFFGCFLCCVCLFCVCFCVGLCLCKTCVFVPRSIEIVTFPRKTETSQNCLLIFVWKKTFRKQSWKSSKILSKKVTTTTANPGNRRGFCVGVFNVLFMFYCFSFFCIVLNFSFFPLFILLHFSCFMFFFSFLFFSFCCEPFVHVYVDV